MQDVKKPYTSFMSVPPFCTLSLLPKNNLFRVLILRLYYLQQLSYLILFKTNDGNKNFINQVASVLV